MRSQAEGRFTATFVKLASKPKPAAKSEALTDDEKAELSTSISEAAGVDIPHQDAQERLEASMETLLGLIPACIPDQLPHATWLHATLKSAVRWANDEMWNELPQVEALLTVTHSIMVSKDTKWERLSAVVRRVETCKHITSDGCFLGDKVTQVLAEGEKLVKSAETHLCEHYKIGVQSAHKELVPIAGGMNDGSQWSSKIIEQDWEGICETAKKTLMKSDAKLRKQCKDALREVCG